MKILVGVAISPILLFLHYNAAFAIPDTAQSPPVSVRANANTASSTNSPIEVQISLAKNTIRVGEPIVVVYRIINHSTSPQVLLLPDEGKTWLKIHLRDKDGHEIGVAGADDFAGQKTVMGFAGREWQPAVTTRLHLKPQGPVFASSNPPLLITPFPGAPEIPNNLAQAINWGNAFTDRFVLGPTAFGALPNGEFAPGTYTITAESTASYREDLVVANRSRHKITSASNGDNTQRFVPYEVGRFEDALYRNGSFVTNPKTGERTLVLDPLPMIPPPTGQGQQTVEVRLTVIPTIARERTAFRVEAEDLVAQMMEQYEMLTKLPPGPETLPSSLFRQPFRDALTVLFSRYDLAARRAKEAVAETVEKLTAKNRGTDEVFFRFVADLGTSDAADFLADQAWGHGRRAAIGALGTMTTYSGVQVKKKVRALFEAHHEKIPKTAIMMD